MLSSRMLDVARNLTNAQLKKPKIRCDQFEFVSSPYFPKNASVPASNLLRKSTRNLRKSVSDEIKKRSKTKDVIKKSIHTLTNETKSILSNYTNCNKIDTNLIKMIDKQHSMMDKQKKNFIKLNKSYCRNRQVTVTEKAIEALKPFKVQAEKATEKKKKKKRPKWLKKLKGSLQAGEKQPSQTYLSKIGISDEDSHSRPSNPDNVSTQIEMEKIGDSDESNELMSYQLGKCVIRFQDKTTCGTSTEEISYNEGNVVITQSDSVGNCVVRQRSGGRKKSPTKAVRNQKNLLKNRKNSAHSKISRKTEIRKKKSFVEDWHEDKTVHYYEMNRSRPSVGYGDGFDKSSKKNNLKNSSKNMKNEVNEQAQIYPYEFYREPQHVPRIKVAYVRPRSGSPPPPVAFTSSKDLVQKWQNDSERWNKSKPESRVQARNKKYNTPQIVPTQRISALPIRTWDRFNKFDSNGKKPSITQQMSNASILPHQPINMKQREGSMLMPQVNFPRTPRMSYKNRLLSYRKANLRELPKIDESARESLNNSVQTSPNFSVTTLDSIKKMIPQNKWESQQILDRIRKVIHDQVNKQQVMDEVPTPRPVISFRKPFRFL